MRDLCTGGGRGAAVAALVAVMENKQTGSGRRRPAAENAHDAKQKQGTREAETERANKKQVVVDDNKSGLVETNDCTEHKKTRQYGEFLKRHQISELAQQEDDIINELKLDAPKNAATNGAICKQPLGNKTQTSDTRRAACSRAEVINKSCDPNYTVGSNNSETEERFISKNNEVCRETADEFTVEHSVENTSDFENAVKHFNLTARNVQQFVAASMKLAKTTHATDQVSLVSSSTTELSASDESDTSSDCETDETEDHEKLLAIGLATITEEERFTASSVHTTEDDQGSSDESSSREDDLTIKDQADRWCNSSNHDGCTTDSSSTSSDTPVVKDVKDSSTRCSDFQWIRKDLKDTASTIKPQSPPPPKMDEFVQAQKPPIPLGHGRTPRERTPRRSMEKSPAPGSLDRRRHHQQTRHERDQKSRSSHVLKSPPRLEDFVGNGATGHGCQNWCCNPSAAPHPDAYFENFHRRHERSDPQRYGSNPMLMPGFLERGSHPDLYGERLRHDSMVGGCSCNYHMPTPPPCFYYGDNRGAYPYWTPKAPDQDERCRKLQSERDNLQLQVQVLSEQIEAQSDKIIDLEKSLTEKKQLLISSEDLLQREMLSRSSLETQKLELMSAMSEMKLQQASLERENMELRSIHYNNNSTQMNGIQPKLPYLPRMSPQPTLTSTPVHHNSNQGLSMRMSPSPSPVSGSLATSPRRIETNAQDTSPKTPPATYRRQIEVQYASLPRQQFLSNGGSSLSVVDSNANPQTNGVRKGVAFGMGLSSLLGGRARGQSVPNLAETEKIVIDEDPNNDSGLQSPSLSFNKNKGIKRIFGKMKRSGSGNLEDLPGSIEFQRGGVRATASARLGWSEPQMTSKPDKPFAEWDTENICDWLQDLGLDQYVPDAKKWVKSGQHMQESNINEIEKELGIKNSMHRKKLQLALIDTEENSSSDPFLSKAGKLDTAWVLRWLDDTGLPQHKENFLINRIDGRVLHRLTMDDLALLHVTSLLHVASIKRGIQVLRENDYEPGCLQRRSLPDDPEEPVPKQISLWTTHRVMEWLRAVDLAEYAPNLRGAGVHGGLMVLENKFTAELLASILSIPPGKTLLRRHLNTHFKDLLGKDTIQGKREAESTLGYIPLTPASKLKVAKKSHFSLKRNKSKSEADYGDLVCPFNSNTGEKTKNGSANSVGMTRKNIREEGAYLHVDDESSSGSYPHSATSSPLPDRVDL